MSGTAIANLKIKPITRMGNHLGDLEDNPHAPGVLHHVTQMLVKLKSWDMMTSELIEYINTEVDSELEKDQDILN